jgi:hypothetical protein
MATNIRPSPSSRSTPSMSRNNRPDARRGSTGTQKHSYYVPLLVLTGLVHDEAHVFPLSRQSQSACFRACTFTKIRSLNRRSNLPSWPGVIRTLTRNSILSNARMRHLTWPGPAVHPGRAAALAAARCGRHDGRPAGTHHRVIDPSPWTGVVAVRLAALWHRSHRELCELRRPRWAEPVREE